VTAKPVSWGVLWTSAPTLGQGPVACWCQGVTPWWHVSMRRPSPGHNHRIRPSVGNVGLSPHWSCKRLLNILELTLHPAQICIFLFFMV